MSARPTILDAIEALNDRLHAFTGTEHDDETVRITHGPDGDLSPTLVGLDITAEEVQGYGRGSFIDMARLIAAGMVDVPQALATSGTNGLLIGLILADLRRAHDAQEADHAS